VCPAPLRGEGRTSHRAVSRPITVVLTAIVVLGIAVASLALAAPGRAVGAGTAVDPPAIHLADGSSFWVSPPDLDDVVSFTVSGESSPGRYGVVATVYGALQTRSAFDVTRQGSPDTGVLAQTGDPIPLSSLAGAFGGYTLTLAIHTGDGAPQPGDASIDLGCRAGSCDGVYPLELRLVPLDGSDPGTGSSRGPRGSLLTYLVYTYRSEHKLDFAWILPMSVPPVTAGAGGHVDPPSSKSVAALSGLADAVASDPDVPMTIEPSPDSLEALRTGDARGRQVASAVSQLSALPNHETLAQSFVPVDASALVDGGLGSELPLQRRRADQVLAAQRPTTDTWVVDPSSATAPVATLTGVGVERLVVPPSAVDGGDCGVFTCTQPFRLDQPGVEAVLSDPGLQADLPSSASSDAVLDAHRLTAELALVFLEQPNAEDQRAVVLATPQEWDASPTFVRQLLQGLGGSPVVQSVPLAQVFSTAPVGGNSSIDTQPARRSSVPGTNAAGDVAARALRSTRSRLHGFDVAVDAPVASQLDDLLLAAQSSQLPPAGQRRAALGVDAGIGSQLSGLSLPTAPIRLTSSAARVPITVAKTLPYRVVGTLTVSSDKLLFGATADCTPTRPGSGGSTSVECHMVLDRSSNTVYVNMRSRASGDFRVAVTLRSPDGSLTMAVARMSVRSISTSAVAIALSLGAAAVLLGWWGRTLWRGRRSGRGAHVHRGRRA
jgi:hypothetical protein